MSTWDGAAYQQRFDELAAQGVDVHGEAAFVAAYAPASVLDAGCGTGRVAIELDRRGITAVGVDHDASMIAEARRRAPHLRWVEGDLAGDVDLAATFDVVVMAGNVPLFTAPGTAAALVAGCARHVAPGGRLVAGFSLDGRYDLADYDRAAAAAGMAFESRWATWDGDAFHDTSDYAVSVHHRPAAPPR